jgi:hypothetical protein
VLRRLHPSKHSSPCVFRGCPVRHPKRYSVSYRFKLISDGTGLFARANGEETLMGTINPTSPTTTTSSISNGAYKGSILVSETSTLALLAPATAVGAVGGALRRRREAIAR